MREQLRDSYSETGRPSIDPELLLRILLIGYLYGITSERKLVEEFAHASGMALVHRACARKLDPRSACGIAHLMNLQRCAIETTRFGDRIVPS